MEETTVYFIGGCLCGLLVGIILGGILGFINPIWPPESTQKLGSAICEQEYDMEFDRFTDGKLYCKEKSEQYDGVFVRFNEPLILNNN